MSKNQEGHKIQISSPKFSLFLQDDIESKILSPLHCLRDFDSHILLEFDLPLVNKKDLQVTIDNNVISIEAKLREKYIDKKLGRISEFLYFRKSLSLPPNIIPKKIMAQFQNGRLTIKIPKQKTGQKIKVK